MSLIHESLLTVISHLIKNHYLLYLHTRTL